MSQKGLSFQALHDSSFDRPPTADCTTTPRLSKAGMLALLASRLAVGRIPETWSTNKSKWNRDFNVTEIIAKFGSADLIVRSSAAGEDAEGDGKAGAYLSLRCSADPAELAAAIEAVFASYGEGSSVDEIIVQPYLAGSQAAGVAFTRDPSNGADYLIVEYEVGGGTDAVTSGGSTDVRRYVRWNGSSLIDRVPQELGDLLSALSEITAVLGSAPLDVEFAVIGGRAVILQVRALHLLAPPHNGPTVLQLNLLASTIATKLAPHPYLHGHLGLLGIMPDWNPAEIIGIRPRPLASSIYSFLITDSTWAKARYRYGYRDTRNVPLLLFLAGFPYVDVRASFNSFLPSGLPDRIADQVIGAQIDYLTQNPQFHDKIEFDVAVTCWTPDVTERIARVIPGLEMKDRDTLVRKLRKLVNSLAILAP